MRKLVVAVVLALALPGCAILDKVTGKDDRPPGVEQVKPRNLTATRIIESYTAVSATATLLDTAAKQGTITKVQAQKGSQLLKVAMAAIDRSLELWVSGEKDKSANALEAAMAAVEEARVQTKKATDKGGK